MKIFVVLSLLCISLCMGCSNLPKLAACNNQPGGECSCQAGLACRLTKELIYNGETVAVKQCMPMDEVIEVETVDMDNPSGVFPRNKRWLFGIFNRCAQESDCKPNYCCAFGKRCVPKIWKYFTCSLTNLHKCGCRDELECRETASITLPVSDTVIPIRQCLDPKGE